MGLFEDFFAKIYLVHEVVFVAQEVQLYFKDKFVTWKVVKIGGVNLTIVKKKTQALIQDLEIRWILRKLSSWTY